MTNSSKIVLGIVLTVYIFAIIAILSPVLNYAFHPSFLGFGLLYSLLFAVVCSFLFRLLDNPEKGLLSCIKNDYELKKIWLYIHSINSIFMVSLIPILLSVIILLTFQFAPNNFAIIFMYTQIILVIVTMKMWYFHGLLGMGYRWFANGTSLGIRSYATLSLRYLGKDDKKGIRYLINSLVLLQDLIEDMRLELSQLDKTITSLRCFKTFKSDIPYNKICQLAECIVDFPSIHNLPNIMDDFLNNEQISWTNKFSNTKRKATSNLKIILAIATLLSALTFLPETVRKDLLNIIQDLGSIENIQFFIGIGLLVAIAYLASRIENNFLSIGAIKKGYHSHSK